jgi:hypothetical protein
MSKYYSYKNKTEERKIAKRTFFYIFLTVASILAIFFFGIPVLIKFASFLTDINKSGKSVEVSDTIPPPPPRLINLPEATNSKSVDIKGTSEPGATVTLNVNNDKQEVVVGNEGEFMINIQLKDGENSIYAYSTDQSGNESQKTETHKIVFDKQNPEIAINKPKEGETFSGSKQRQITIEGTTEIQASLKINDRFVLVEDDGNFTFLTALTSGENNFNIKAEDKAGNTSEKSLKVIYNP